MEKKVFLQKGLRKGGGGHAPYLKYLMLAVVALILLVLVTPHLIKPKGKDVTRRSIPERGTLMKEIPKPPELGPHETSPETARSNESAPEPAKPPEQGAMTARAPAQEPPPPAPPVEKEPAPMTKPAEPPALFPKAGSPAAPSVSQKPSPGQPPAKGQQKTGKAEMTASAPQAAQKGQQPGKDILSGTQPALAAPAKAISGKQMFAVQVGCFREKQGAEEVQRSLRKKGYDVILCPSAASTGGSYAYTVMTKPVDNIRKAATVVEQIKNEQKVSPTIIKMPPVCDMGGGKQPPEKTAQKAQPAKPSPAGQ
jgi:hypothetical protein